MDIHDFIKTFIVASLSMSAFFYCIDVSINAAPWLVLSIIAIARIIKDGK